MCWRFISYFADIIDHAALASHLFDNSARVVRYGWTLRAVTEAVAKSGRNPDEFALHSLRIVGATTLAVRGGVSERVTQREERWRTDVADKAYTRGNKKDT